MATIAIAATGVTATTAATSATGATDATGATGATAATAATAAANIKLDDFDAFFAHVRQFVPIRLFCNHATPTQEHFSAVAVYAHRPPLWFAASSMRDVDPAEDFDLAAHLLEFNRRFSSILNGHNAMDVTELRHAHAIQASMDNIRVATTSEVHFLSFGYVVCFDAKLVIRNAEAVLLQRAGCSGTRTYDAVVFYKQDSKDKSQEFRLIPKQNLVETQGWAERSHCFMFSSPDLPIDPKLILKARKEGESWHDIAAALMGSDESSDPDSDWHESDSEWEAAEEDDSDCTSDLEMTLEEVHQMLC